MPSHNSGLAMPMDICCLNWKGLFAYLRKRHGEAGVDKVIEGLVDNPRYLVADKNDPTLVRPIKKGDLEDSAYWVSNDYSLRLLARVPEVVEGPDALRAAGEGAVLGQLSGKELLLSRLIGPTALAKRAAKVNALFNNTKAVELAELGSGQAVYRLRYRPGFKVTKDVCRWNLGIYAGLVKACGCRLMRAQETKCVVDGDDCCQLHIAWGRPRLHHRLTNWLLHRSFKDLLSQYESILEEKASLTSRLLSEASARQKAQREMAELAGIVASSRDAIIGMDLEGVITSFNQAAERLYGYGAAEALGRHVSMLIPPGHPDRANQLWAAVAKGGMVQQYETVRQAKDGRLVDVSVTISPILDEAGKLVGISGISQDISARKQAEEDLRHSEETFRLAFHTSPDAIAISRARDGLYLDVNQGFEELSGYSRQEVLGKTSLDINIWADPRDRLLLLEGLKVGGRVTNQEVTFLLKDGRQMPGLLSAVVFTLNGEPHIYSTTRTIAEQKQAEQALRESQERYRLLVESAAEAIVVAQDGLSRFFNARALELTGFSAEEYATHPFIEYVHPDDRQMIGENYRRRLAGENVASGYPFRIVTKGGQVRWVRANSVLIQWQGRPATLNMVTDITEAKQAEEELKASQERYRSVVENVPYGLVILDLPSTRVLFCNSSAARMFGYTPEEALGLSAFDVTDPAEHQRARQAIEERLRGVGTSPRQVYDGVRKDGSAMRYEVRVSPIEYQGRPALQGVLLDVTETERLERLVQDAHKMEAVGTLAGGMAHEFNNLLAIIMGYAEVIQGVAQGQEAVENSVAQIIKASERGRDLIQQILTFARYSEPEVGPLSLNAEISSSREMLSRLLPKTLTIETELTPDLHYVNMSANHLGQVLMNLATNASQAMPEGGKLTIKTENARVEQLVCTTCGQPFSGQYVLLSVSDTGQGMDQETIQRIFEPFFSTKEVGTGTGLGLSVVLGLVKSYQGHVICQSAPGQGATFQIFLPALAEPAARAGGEDQASPLSPGGGETILLVDDEQTLRDMGRLYFTDMGYQVLLAGSGEEALRVYRQHPGQIDLVLLDLGMPGMGGHKCLRELMAIDPGAKVIITSGYTTNGQDQQTLLAGAVAFVAKPFRQADLLARVRAVLDKK